MAKYGETDMYAFIMSRGLMYRKIGNQNNYQIVAGQELLWEGNGYFMFTIDDEGEIHLETRDGSQTEVLKAQEKDIQQKLFSIGAMGQPKYYVITNYEV
jgi:hypothetical protein